MHKALLEEAWEKAVIVIMGISCIASFLLVGALDTAPPLGNFIYELLCHFVILGFLCLWNLEVMKEAREKQKKSLSAGTLKDKEKTNTVNMIPRKGKKIKWQHSTKLQGII